MRSMHKMTKIAAAAPDVDGARGRPQNLLIRDPRLAPGHQRYRLSCRTDREICKHCTLPARQWRGGAADRAREPKLVGRLAPGKLTTHRLLAHSATPSMTVLASTSRL